MAVQNFPYYKKTVMLGDHLPVISYGKLTPAERVYQSDLNWENQRSADEKAAKIIDSIAELLELSKVKATGVYLHVRQYLDPNYDELGRPMESPYGVPSMDELAAVEMAERALRTPPDKVLYAQYTFFMNSRIDWSALDAKAFQQRYGVAIAKEWTIDHTMAIEEFHAALDAFLISESNNIQIADSEPAPATAGESMAD